MSTTEKELARMTELQKTLHKASDAYYNSEEIMSNYEYDQLYDELVALETKTGVILDGSITQSVGAEVLDGDLEKVTHPEPMLSLAKTKSRDELLAWLGDKTGCLSWKLDGSTVVLTYREGRLFKAVTRGNGIVGEDVTKQALRFDYVPRKIDFNGELVVRGEVLMTYSEFERVNKEYAEEQRKIISKKMLDDGSNKIEIKEFKNPRNLANSTMRALNLELLNKRHVEFHPFTLVSASGIDMNSYCERLDWLATLGFKPVEHKKVSRDDLLASMKDFESRVSDFDIPVDGLVLFFDDVAYGNSLGATGHAPKNGIAFKWLDTTMKTTLRKIVWQISRTGRLNPVAIFDPVQIEGTEIEKAFLHNITYIEDMKLGIGDTIDVYKANMIIPQIAKNESETLERIEDVLPDECPSCHGSVSRVADNDSEYLVCDNPDCPGRKIDSFARFVSPNALDIQGLGPKLIEKFMDEGIITSYIDILDLEKKRAEIIDDDNPKKFKLIKGIATARFDSLVRNIEKAKHTTMPKFIYALGIDEFGVETAKLVSTAYNNDLDKLLEACESYGVDALINIEGIGNVAAHNFIEYITNNSTMIEELRSRLYFVDKTSDDNANDNNSKADTFINSKTFVVTGKLHVFANRDSLKAFIEKHGGKVTGSVTSKTDYLVMNDPNSKSNKAVAARKHDVKIITEEQFVNDANFAS